MHACMQVQQMGRDVMGVMRVRTGRYMWVAPVKGKMSRQMCTLGDGERVGRWGRS